MIKSHKLQQFVVNLVVPPHYLTGDGRIADRVNPEYETWEVQDQTLLVWLQSTLSKSVLSRVLGSNHSYQVWEVMILSPKYDFSARLLLHSSEPIFVCQSLFHSFRLRMIEKK